MCFLQNFPKVFTDSEVRNEVGKRLFRPTMDWGPALPEVRRRLSVPAYPVMPEDDDVFADGAELKDIKTYPEKDRLVRFSDSSPPDDAETGDSGRKPSTVVEEKNETTEETEKLYPKLSDDEPKV